MGLYSKLAEIMGAMRNVPKTGKHPQGYSFATEGDIVEQVRTELAARSVALMVSITGYESNQISETKNGQPIFRTICTFNFALIDGETGEVANAQWVNEAMDSSDKGFNKAATAALKYWLIKTFMIPTGLPDAHEMNKTTRNGLPERSQGNPHSAPAQPAAQTERPATPKAAATQDGELTHDEAFQLVMKHPDVVRTLSNSGERAKRWNAVKPTLPDKVTITTAVNAMLEAA